MIGKTIKVPCKECGRKVEIYKIAEIRKHLAKCDECEIRSKKHKTKKQLASKIYTAQKINSKARGHLMPIYSREEFYKWFLSHKDLDRIYNAWVVDYDTLKVPSVDRLDDSKGYSFENIRLVTWKENWLKAQGMYLKKI